MDPNLGERELNITLFKNRPLGEEKEVGEGALGRAKEAVKVNPSIHLFKDGATINVVLTVRKNTSSAIRLIPRLMF